MLNVNKFLIIILLFFIIQTTSFCEETVNASTNPEMPITYTAAQQERDVVVFSEKDKFGLKDKEGNIVAPPVYQKMIMTGKQGWIVQKNDKYGLMDSSGNYLIKPKYRYADRIFGRYVKLGNRNDFGIYNEFGEQLLEPDYSTIELLYGKMFLTCKNFRYGVMDFNGNVLIPNICDDIYMPAKDKMRVKYNGKWYEISDISPDKLEIHEIVDDSSDDMEEFNFKNVLAETGNISGYSVLTLSDYLVKVVSSFSPAHEETIDELILSHGVDTVGILKKFSWIPKYPVTFTRNYFSYLRNPFTGPLSDKRNSLKNNKR